MNFYTNSENQPSNNMVQRYGTPQREMPNANGRNQYVDINIRRGFRPPLQMTRPITTLHDIYRNLLDQPTNIPSTTPAQLDRMTPVAGPSRNHIIQIGHNTVSSVFNNPGASVNRSRNNFDISIDNRRNTHNIGVRMSEITVQDTVASVPKLLPVSANINTAKKNSTEQNSTMENNASTTNSNTNGKIFGSSDNEKMFIFTGTVERVIKWNKIFSNHFCYFEAIAAVISIQEGAIKTQRIMLLRDRKGPILQVIYYTTTHMDIEDFHVGQILRCVGKMSSTNILNAISIRSASQEEIDTLQRLSLVCDHSISHFLNP